jgi:hypothetical protein
VGSVSAQETSIHSKKHRNSIHINLVPPVDTELDPGSQTYVGGGIDTPSTTRVNADRGCPGEKSAP